MTTRVGHRPLGCPQPGRSGSAGVGLRWRIVAIGGTWGDIRSTRHLVFLRRRLIVVNDALGDICGHTDRLGSSGH
jgi:hypothetical protein